MKRLLIAAALLLGFAGQATAALPPTQCVSTAIAGGTADNITIPNLPCIPTTTLLILTIVQPNQTSGPTISVGGGAAQLITRYNGSSLAPNELVANGHVLLMNNGNTWFLLSPDPGIAPAPSFTPYQPEFYGAIGNGIADDTAAFTTACNAEPVRGLSLSGIYLITENRTFSCPMVFGSAAAVKADTGIVISLTGEVSSANSTNMFPGPGAVSIAGIFGLPDHFNTGLAGNQIYLGPGTPVTSWANTTWPNSTNVGAVVGVETIGGYGIVGAARISDDPNRGAGGVFGLCDANSVTAVAPVGCWGGYFEAVRRAGVTTPQQGIEVDVANFGTTVPIGPYNMHPNGITVPAWLACGGSAAGTTPCSAAIGIIPNIRQFETGITFQSDALDPARGTGTNGLAMDMAVGQSIRWTAGADVSTFEMWGTSAGLATYCNSQTIPISVATAFGICSNFSGGGAEVDFWSLQDNSEGFFFHQKRGFNAESVVMTAGFNGASVVQYNVGTLPGCNINTKYRFVEVVDASAPTFNGTLTGGGASVVFAICDGTSWRAS